MNILDGILVMIVGGFIVSAITVVVIQLLNWLDERKFICRRCEHCDMIKGKVAECNMLVEDVIEISYCCLYERRSPKTGHHDKEIS